MRIESGESAITATTCSTVAAAVALIEPALAVIVAEPLLSACTTPEVETVATLDDDDAQATEAPVIVAPF